MEGFTYEKIITNKSVRDEFLNLYAAFVKEVQRRGYVTTAMTHAKILKRMREELSLLD